MKEGMIVMMEYLKDLMRSLFLVALFLRICLKGIEMRVGPQRDVHSS